MGGSSAAHVRSVYAQVELNCHRLRGLALAKEWTRVLSFCTILTFVLDNWHEVLIDALGLPTLPDQMLAKRTAGWFREIRTGNRQSGAVNLNLGLSLFALAEELLEFFLGHHSGVELSFDRLTSPIIDESLAVLRDQRIPTRTNVSAEDHGIPELTSLSICQ